MDNNLLVLDIGNSKIKIKYKNNYYSCKLFEIKNKLNDLIKYEFENTTAIISSVNNKNNVLVQKILTEKQIKQVYLNKLLNNQDIIDFSDIENMGTDRKFGLFGAIKNYDVPLITIDCGTATTINAIDENYKCLGGNIFAGLHTHSKSLNIMTSKLPYIKRFSKEDINIGTNTEEAISNGIMAATIGGILILVKLIITTNFWISPNIIITGGAGNIILDYLNDEYIKSTFDIPVANFILEKYLVVDGIEYLYDKENNS